MNKSDVYFSAFERKEDDNYPTIDTRCLDGLLAYVPVFGKIVDPCARGGSALVEQFNRIGRPATGLDDCFEMSYGDWQVTNPPFTKKEVTQIVQHMIDGVDTGRFHGLALLVRNNWAFAKTRVSLFERPTYSGEIKLVFRVFWTDARDSEPKHNYVWHVWRKDGWAYPLRKLYLPPYDKRYVVRRLA